MHLFSQSWPCAEEYRGNVHGEKALLGVDAYEKMPVGGVFFVLFLKKTNKQNILCGNRPIDMVFVMLTADPLLPHFVAQPNRLSVNRAINAVFPPCPHADACVPNVYSPPAHAPGCLSCVILVLVLQGGTRASAMRHRLVRQAVCGRAVAKTGPYRLLERQEDSLPSAQHELPCIRYNVGVRLRFAVFFSLAHYTVVKKKRVWSWYWVRTGC